MGESGDLRDRARQNLSIIIIVGLFILILGNLFVFLLANILVASLMILRVLYSGFRKREKLILITAYFILLLIQSLFDSSIVFEPNQANLFKYGFLRLSGVLLLFIPLYIERFVTANKNVRFYLPSVDEVYAIGFSDFIEKRDDIIRRFNNIEETAGKLTIKNISKIVSDSINTSSVRYTNKDSLTKEWFEEARLSLDEPYIYIIVSDTGSPASEVIGTMTKRAYNHVSIAFDFEIKTILSYNGGNNIYQPGLNPETIAFFRKKPDASILIYRLKADYNQKLSIINKIEEINNEGSAYNLMGLFTKNSYKPNIMFCSQFVYTMLDLVGLSYFSKPPCEVRPLDFVELDYYRRLEFVKKVSFIDKNTFN